MRLSRWLVGLTASCLIPWGSGTLRADSLACTNVTNVVETDRTHLGYNPYREFRLPGTSDGCLKCPRNIVNLPIQLQLALFLSFSLSLSLFLSFSLWLFRSLSLCLRRVARWPPPLPGCAERLRSALRASSNSSFSARESGRQSPKMCLLVNINIINNKNYDVCIMYYIYIYIIELYIYIYICI